MNKSTYIGRTLPEQSAGNTKGIRPAIAGREPLETEC